MDLPLNLIATPEDFIKSFGQQEAIELTFPGDPSQLEPDNDAIQCALDDALQEVLAFECIACPQGRVAIRKNLRRYMLIFSRYYLDSCLLRKNVSDQAERVWKNLEKFCSQEYCERIPSPEELEEVGLDPITGIKACFEKRVFTRESLECFRDQPLYEGGRYNDTIGRANRSRNGGYGGIGHKW